MELNIGKHYSKYPGGRKKSSGEFSGEHFLESCLGEFYKKAFDANESLTIILDGLYGYPSSFLEESFGGLVRINKDKGKDVLDRLEFVSKENLLLIERIRNYMRNALNG